MAGIELAATKFKISSRLGGESGEALTWKDQSPVFRSCERFNDAFNVGCIIYRRRNRFDRKRWR